MRLLASSVVVLIPLLAAGQSMSDTAQKERERREKQKAAGASAAVITEESLKANKGSLANDPGAAKSGAGKTARPNSRPGAAPAAPVLAEQEWRARAKETRRRIADRQRRYDSLANLRLDPGAFFLDENGYRVAASAENRDRALAAAKLQLEIANKDLEDLQEEARLKNVPEGLLR